VLPIAAYWLALAGATYAVVRSPAPEPLIEAPHDRMSDRSLITDAVPNHPPASPMAKSDGSSDISDSIAAPSNAAPDPSPIATREQVPNRPAVMDAVPFDAAALDQAFASAPAAPRITRNQDPAPSPPAPLELPQEPAQREEETSSRLLDTETPRRDSPSTALPSCEAAADAANQTIDLRASRGVPDLTRDAFAAVLENGTYLRSCAIPARTALEVCAAIQDGRVVGVTVTTEPRDPAISACVRRAVAALRFARTPRLDVTRTRFESTR
jgi:hypothetical protein